jgi:TRAP-type C4-dicarboxylate transport system substrate-binding protein
MTVQRAGRSLLDMRSAYTPWAAATFLALTAGCSGSATTKVGGHTPAKPVVLTFASVISGGQPTVLEAFAQEVDRRSHGSMSIRFLANWRPSDTRQEPETVDDVRRGRVDLAWVPARTWDWLGIHEFDALIAPFLVDSYASEAAVFRAGIPSRMLAGVTRAGVEPIGILPGPLRVLLDVHDLLLNPRDFRGRTVGVAGALAAATFRTLGARTRNVYAQTPITGLDAIEMQPSSVANNQYDSTAHYLVTNVVFWPRPLVLIAAPRVWHRLSPSQRTILTAASATAAAAGIRLARQAEGDGLRELCRRGRIHFVSANAADVARLVHAEAPLYKRLASERVTRTYLAEIARLKRGHPREHPARCTNTPLSFGHAASVIDGTWKMSVTPDYLIHHHPSYLPPPPPEALKLDSGSYRFELRHGRVEYAHRAPLIQVHSTGVFAVRGDTIVFVWTGGHDAGEGPNRYRWSLYRGALTFRPIGRVPAEFGLAPWHRTGR